MAGLLGDLASSSRALDAQRYGLSVAGQNIANLNTPGYVRRSVLLAEGSAQAGGGVQIQGTEAHRDVFIEARLRGEVVAQQREGTLADSLAVVETSLGAAGESIDHGLTVFFDAFATLAQDPTSSVARDGVVLQGRLLASSFNEISSRLDDSRNAADAKIRDTAGQINTLASQISGLNAAIANANGVDVDGLKDQQVAALKTLAGLVNTTVMARADGGSDVTIGSGRALVVGANAYALQVTSAPVTGLAVINGNGLNITSELTDGVVGGLLQVRDTLVPGYKTQLDQLAAGVVQQVNTLHQAGYDLNGATGNVFFTPLAGVAGAAAAMAVDPALAANTRRIAASAAGTVGDNQQSRAIADLRDALTMSGGTETFTQAWSRLVYQNGSDAQQALSNQKSRGNIVSSLESLRESVSGVSLDEESAMMLKFQRAYEANAKYFSVVNNSLDVLMNMVT